MSENQNVQIKFIYWIIIAFNYLAIDYELIDLEISFHTH